MTVAALRVYWLVGWLPEAREGVDRFHSLSMAVTGRSSEGPKVAVVGGSIVGCAAAAALDEIGCRVTVLERSRSPLQTRGSGLVLPGRLIPSLIERHLLPPDTPSIRLWGRRWIVEDGDAQAGRCLWEQPFTVNAVSWSTFFSEFRRRVPDGAYTPASEVVGADQVADGVRLRLANGQALDFDLAVAADGYQSTVRRLLFSNFEQTYSGYIVWRGWFNERDGRIPSVAPLGGGIMHTIGFEKGHANFWLIPTAAGAGFGQRQVTWNIYGGPLPPGVAQQDGAVQAVPRLSPEQRAFLDDLARRYFPPMFASVVEATPAPIITPVYDVRIPALVAGRVALVGDAATVVRPVTGSGAVKGLEDVMALVDALRDEGFAIDRALEAFNANRLPVGHGLVDLGQRMGSSLVDQAPEWARMTADEMQAWMTDLMSGWYALEEAVEAESGTS